MNPSASQLSEGRRLLRMMLPTARRRAAEESPADVKLVSAVAMAQLKYITEANLEAVLIYRTDIEAWHADVLLKDTPPAIANALGSPVDDPLPTRGAALRFAEQLLLTVVLLTKKAKQEAEDYPPVFVLFGWSLELSTEALNKCAKLAADVQPYKTREEALDRLQYWLRHFRFDEHFEFADYEKLDREGRAAFMAVIYGAAVHGILRWPEGE